MVKNQTLFIGNIVFMFMCEKNVVWKRIYGRDRLKKNNSKTLTYMRQTVFIFRHFVGESTQNSMLLNNDFFLLKFKVWLTYNKGSNSSILTRMCVLF